MRRYFGTVFLLILLLAMLHQPAAATVNDAGQYTMTIPDFRHMGYMTFSPEMESRYQSEYDNATRAVNMPASVSIQSIPTSYRISIPYNATERNQGSAGNCWIWASLAPFEAWNAYHNNWPQRLSVQFFDTNYHAGGWGDFYTGWAACGGTAKDFEQYLNNAFDPTGGSGGGGILQFWENNTNYAYLDGGQTKNDRSFVPPPLVYDDWHFNTAGPVEAVVIPTRREDGVGQAGAIANIKNHVLDNRPVYLAIHLPNSDAMADFQGWWASESKGNTIIAYDFPAWALGRTVEEKKPGHAVAVIGYYDDGTAENSYWECLNSWGSPLQHPDGIFRVPMYIDYEAETSDGVHILDFWAFVFPGCLPTIANPVSIDLNPVDPTTESPVKATVQYVGSLPTQLWVSWDDGQFTSRPFNANSDITRQFNVDDAGTHQVAVKLQNAQGTSEPISRSFYVEGVPPIPEFSWEQTSVWIPHNRALTPRATVQFQDYTTRGTPESYNWDFGDGGTSNEANPTHVFNKVNKDFNVKLMVSNGYGSSSVTQAVHVFDFVPPAVVRHRVLNYEIFRGIDNKPDKPIPIEIAIRNRRLSVPVGLQIANSQATALAVTGQSVRESSSGVTISSFPAPVHLDTPKFRIPAGGNKTITEILNTTRLNPGTYRFTIKVKEVSPQRVDATLPVIINVYDPPAHPTIAVTTKSVAFGNLRVGDEVTKHLWINNSGSAPLTYDLAGPIGCGFSPVNGTVAPHSGANIGVTLNTQQIADYTWEVQKAVRITCNDPLTPEVTIPITYTFSTPKAQVLGVDLRDQGGSRIEGVTIYPGRNYTIKMTLMNSGTIPWTRLTPGGGMENFTLQTAPAGDAGIFGEGALGLPVPVVNPGENVTFDWPISVPDNGCTDCYPQELTLVYEMSWLDSASVRHRFGGLVFCLVTIERPELSAPSVMSLMPDTGFRGTTVNITVHGTNFVSGATMKGTRGNPSDGPEYYESPAMPTTDVSADQLNCSFPIPDGIPIGMWNMTVTNPDNQNGTLVNGFTIAESRSLEVVVPDGGEVWQTGTTCNITWNQTGFDGTNVRIDLWKDLLFGTQVCEISSSVPAEAGTYSWTIPADIPSGTTYWVKIASLISPSVYDGSDGSLQITALTGSVCVSNHDFYGNPLPGWTFTLKNQTMGTPVYTNVTDSAGITWFNNVPYGMYWLNETTETGWSQITANKLISVPPDTPPEGGSYWFTNYRP